VGKGEGSIGTAAKIEPLAFMLSSSRREKAAMMLAIFPKRK
jgi:hypothetical protein